MARIFEIEGGHDRAIADYTEAIRVDPKFAQAYFNRGRAYEIIGDKAKAREDFGQAKRICDRRRSSSNPWPTPMKILFLHGWQSTPGGVKPTFLKDHGHEVLNPALPDDDFDAAVRIARPSSTSTGPMSSSVPAGAGPSP